MVYSPTVYTVSIFPYYCLECFTSIKHDYANFASVARFAKIKYLYQYLYDITIYAR